MEVIKHGRMELELGSKNSVRVVQPELSPAN